MGVDVSEADKLDHALDVNLKTVEAWQKQVKGLGQENDYLRNTLNERTLDCSDLKVENATLKEAVREAREFVEIAGVLRAGGYVADTRAKAIEWLQKWGKWDE